MYLLDVKHNSFILNRYLSADSKMSLPTYPFLSLTNEKIGIDRVVTYNKLMKAVKAKKN